MYALCRHTSANTQDLLDRNLQCSSQCDRKRTQLWICCTCGFIGCGDHDNRHMARHNAEKKHCIVMNIKQYTLWCYGCGDYITTQYFASSVKRTINELRMSHPVASELKTASSRRFLKKELAQARTDTGRLDPGQLRTAHLVSAHKEGLGLSSASPFDAIARICYSRNGTAGPTPFYFEGMQDGSTAGSGSVIASSFASTRTFTKSIYDDLNFSATGLVNAQTNSCYLNAVMQALCRLTPFSKYFMSMFPYLISMNAKDDTAFLTNFTQAIVAMQLTPSSNAALPRPFMHHIDDSCGKLSLEVLLATLQTLVPTWSGIDQQDAHECFQLLLGFLDESLSGLRFDSGIPQSYLFRKTRCGFEGSILSMLCRRFAGKHILQSLRSSVTARASLLLSKKKNQLSASQRSPVLQQLAPLIRKQSAAAEAVPKKGSQPSRLSLGQQPSPSSKETLASSHPSDRSARDDLLSMQDLNGDASKQHSEQIASNSLTMQGSSESLTLRKCAPAPFLSQSSSGRPNPVTLGHQNVNIDSRCTSPVMGIHRRSPPFSSLSQPSRLLHGSSVGGSDSARRSREHGIFSLEYLVEEYTSGFYDKAVNWDEINRVMASATTSDQPFDGRNSPQQGGILSNLTHLRGEAPPSFSQYSRLLGHMVFGASAISDKVRVIGSCFDPACTCPPTIPTPPLEPSRLLVENSALVDLLQERKSSIVADLFTGVMSNVYRCTCCNFAKKDFELFNDISLGLRDAPATSASTGVGAGAGPITDAPSSQNGSVLGNGDGCSLYQTLQDFTSEESVQGACSCCNKLVCFTKRSMLYYSPEVLCLHLKRFNISCEKMHTRVLVPTTLVLDSFLDPRSPHVSFCSFVSHSLGPNVDVLALIRRVVLLHVVSKAARDLTRYVFSSLADSFDAQNAEFMSLLEAILLAFSSDHLSDMLLLLTGAEPVQPSDRPESSLSLKTFSASQKPCGGVADGAGLRALHASSPAFSLFEQTLRKFILEFASRRVTGNQFDPQMFYLFALRLRWMVTYVCEAFACFLFIVACYDARPRQEFDKLLGDFFKTYEPIRGRRRMDSDSSAFDGPLRHFGIPFNRGTALVRRFVCSIVGEVRNAALSPAHLGEHSFTKSFVAFTQTNMDKIDLSRLYKYHGLLTKSDMFRAGSAVYSLTSFIVHKGDYGGGHYITYCRSPEDTEAKWSCYNDDKVSVLTDDPPLHEAYILYYTKRQNAICDCLKGLFWRTMLEQEDSSSAHPHKNEGEHDLWPEYEAYSRAIYASEDAPHQPAVSSAMAADSYDSLRLFKVVCHARSFLYTLLESLTGFSAEKIVLNSVSLERSRDRLSLTSRSFVSGEWIYKLHSAVWPSGVQFGLPPTSLIGFYSHQGLAIQPAHLGLVYPIHGSLYYALSAVYGTTSCFDLDVDVMSTVYTKLAAGRQRLHECLDQEKVHSCEISLAPGTGHPVYGSAMVDECPWLSGPQNTASASETIEAEIELYDAIFERPRTGSGDCRTALIVRQAVSSSSEAVENVMLKQTGSADELWGLFSFDASDNQPPSSSEQPADQEQLHEQDRLSEADMEVAQPHLKNQASDDVNDPCIFETRYAISCMWISKWRGYLFTGVHRPERIDNDHLFNHVGSLFTQPTLRSDLVKEKDYFIITEKTWTALRHLYSCSERDCLRLDPAYLREKVSLRDVTLYHYYQPTIEKLEDALADCPLTLDYSDPDLVKL